MPLTAPLSLSARTSLTMAAATWATTADLNLLRDSLSVYTDLGGTISEGGIRVAVDWKVGRLPLLISHEMLTALEQGKLHDRDWRDAWQVFTVYFKQRTEDESLSSKKRDSASAQVEKLRQHFETRERWKQSEENAEDILLGEARDLWAIRFGGPLRRYPGININPINSRTPINFWIAGKLSPVYARALFYDECVRDFLSAMDVESDKLDVLINKAIVEHMARKPARKKTRAPRIAVDAEEDVSQGQAKQALSARRVRQTDFPKKRERPSVEARKWPDNLSDRSISIILEINRNVTTIRKRYFNRRWPGKGSIFGVPTLKSPKVKVRRLIAGEIELIHDEFVQLQLRNLLTYKGFTEHETVDKWIEGLKEESERKH